MDLFSIIDLVEDKLLNYEPIKEIYYVERHHNPISEIVGLIEKIRINWIRIRNNFLNVLKVLSLYIDKDDYLDNQESYINEDIFELNLLANNINMTQYESNDVYLEKIAKITLLLNLYACCVVPQGNPKYILNDDWLNYKVNQNVYFRGEEDYNYSLMPSIYRNEMFGVVGKTLNFANFLFPYYYDRKLIEKYNEFQEYTEINYDFCSLMQHAGCKSPLLDITKDPRVALSFASCSNNGKDGSIYVFSGIKETSNDEMRKLSVFAVDRKLDYLTVVRKTPILLCGLDKFELELEILTLKSNDRMKFQKGAFLFINKCIIVNNKVLLPVSNKHIKKYKIPAADKGKIINSLNKRYDKKYLMNPYAFLSDDNL